MGTAVTMATKPVTSELAREVRDMGKFYLSLSVLILVSFMYLSQC